MPAELRIGSRFETAPIETGMNKIVAVGKDSTGQLKTEFNEASLSVEGLNAEIIKLQAEIAALKAEADAEPVGHLTNEVTEARHAAHLLGDEIGVKIPRALQGVLAHSETLGPILAHAFSALAVIGFIELAEKAAEKLTELISEHLIFTEQLKEAAKLAKQESDELEALDKKHIQNLREIELIGADSVTQARLKKQWADENFEAVGDEKKQIEERRAELQKELNVLQAKRELEANKAAQTSAEPESFAIGDTGLSDIDKQIDEVNEKLTKLTGAAVMKARLTEAGDESTASIRRFEVAAEKANEEAAKKAEEAAKRTERAWQEFVDKNDRLVEMQEKLVEDKAEFTAKEAQHETEIETKELEKRVEAQVKFSEARQADTEKAQLAELALKQKGVEDSLAIGQITTEQEVAQLRELATQKLAIETQYLNSRISTITARMLTEDGEAYAKDLEEFSRLLTEKQAAQDRFAQDEVSANRKIQDELKKEYDKQQQEQKAQLDRMTTTFNNALNSWITGHEKFGQAMANMWKQIADQMILQILRGMEQEILAATIQKTIAKQEIETKAHSAAAKAWDWAVGWGGPVAGAAAAGLTFAAVSALNAFEKGGIVPETNIAMLHKNEMVLPEHISSKVQHMVETGQGAGGDTHLHLGVSAVDGASVEALFRNHGGTLRRALQSMVRNGKGL